MGIRLITGFVRAPEIQGLTLNWLYTFSRPAPGEKEKKAFLNLTCGPTRPLGRAFPFKRSVLSHRGRAFDPAPIANGVGPESAGPKGPVGRRIVPFPIEKLSAGWSYLGVPRTEFPHPH